MKSKYVVLKGSDGSFLTVVAAFKSDIPTLTEITAIQREVIEANNISDAAVLYWLDITNDLEV